MRKERLEDLLRAALEPREILVENQSEQHRGHAGHDGIGDSHFHIKIRSERFANMSLLEQHRLVYDTIKTEFGEGLHALALDTGT